MQTYQNMHHVQGPPGVGCRTWLNLKVKLEIDMCIDERLGQLIAGVDSRLNSVSKSVNVIEL